MQKYLTTKKKQMYNGQLLGVLCPCGRQPCPLSSRTKAGPYIPCMHTLDYWCLYPSAQLSPGLPHLNICFLCECFSFAFSFFISCFFFSRFCLFFFIVATLKSEGTRPAFDSFHSACGRGRRWGEQTTKTAYAKSFL